MAKTTAESIGKRWTPRLVEGGFTPVSTFFIDNYHRLKPKMTPAEAMFIIHLVKHKWDEKNPHPSFANLAKRMGLSSTSVRNYARSLEQKRYLNRIDRRSQGETNEFDLKPLFDALERLHMADEEKRKKLKPLRTAEPTGVQAQPDGGQEQGGVLFDHAELERAIREIPADERVKNHLLESLKRPGGPPTIWTAMLASPLQEHVEGAESARSRIAAQRRRHLLIPIEGPVPTAEDRKDDDQD